MGKIKANSNKQPFIMLFAEPRTEAPSLPGEYDEDFKVVTVRQGNHKIPIIKVQRNLETLTKTEQDRESDEECYSPVLLETLTKTATNRESDESGRDCLIELATKTLADRESDEDDKISLTELYTKTKVDREGDDENFDLSNYSYSN